MRNDGTSLQDKLQKALKEYCETSPAYWHRFPDTKSAGRGNYLKAQPGDYMLLVPGPCLLIECKSTMVGTGIISMAFHGGTGKNQIAKHRLWHRAGHPTLYLWGDLANKEVQWHSGRAVVKKISKPLVIGGLDNLLGTLPDVIKIISRETI